MKGGFEPMKRVNRDASVHEKTVQSAGQVKFNGRRKVRSGARSSAVERTQVHPEVMKKALELAGGDASRLRLLSPTEVVVANAR